MILPKLPVWLIILSTLCSKEPTIYIAPYKAAQFYMSMYSNRGEKFDLAGMPVQMLYNNYFGGGMNSIVFQEMRESRALVYTARAYMSIPKDLTKTYAYTTFIASQNDKMVEAINAFRQIINVMPISDKAFALAQNAIMTDISTMRYRDTEIPFFFFKLQKLGLKDDFTKMIYNQIPHLTLKDVEAYQQKMFKGRFFDYGILGDEQQLDIKNLEKNGKVVRLKTEDIFGE